MTRPLAFPSFVTGPKDDLAAPDIYTLVDGTPINKIVPFQATDPVQEKKMSALAGAKGMLGNIKDGLKFAKGVKNINIKEGGNLLSQFGSANQALAQVARALPPSMGDLSKSLNSIMGAAQGAMKDVGGYVAKVNGLQQTFKKGTDLAKITAIGNMINSVSCDSTIFSADNRRMTVGAYSGVIGLAMQSGISGAFGAVLKCEGDVGILNQVAAACLPGTIQMSDITSLGDMANKLSPGVIKGLNPNVINDFNKMFALPAGASASSMRDSWSGMSSTFSAIDPNWNSASFGGEQVASLTCVMGASPDFQNVMATGILTNPNATDDDHLMLAALAQPPSDVKAEIATQFPLLTDVSSLPTTTVSPGILVPDSSNTSVYARATEPEPKTETTSSGSRPPLSLSSSQKEIIRKVNERLGYLVIYKDYYWVQKLAYEKKITPEERDLIAHVISYNPA